MRAAKTVMAALAATMLMGAAVFVPVASASGGSATMDLADVAFPGGGVIPGGASGSVPTTPGSTVNLGANPTLPDASSPLDKYVFMFWDVDGSIKPTANT